MNNLGFHRDDLKFNIGFASVTDGDKAFNYWIVDQISDYFGELVR